MTLVRFTADDPAAAWTAGALAEDLGPESPGVPVWLLHVLETDETLSLTEPWERGLIEPACRDCHAPALLTWHDPGRGADGAYTVTCTACPAEEYMPAATAARSRITAVRRIVRDHAAARVDGYLVDVQTASLLVQVYETLSPTQRERFGAAPLVKLVELSWRVAY